MHYDFQSFYEKKPQANLQFCHHSLLRIYGLPETAPGSESYQLFILTEIRTRETGPATNIVQIFLKAAGLFTICSGCLIVKLHVLQDIFESSSRSVSSKYQSVAIRSQKSEQYLYSAKNISTQFSVFLSFPFHTNGTVSINCYEKLLK